MAKTKKLPQLVEAPDNSKTDLVGLDVSRDGPVFTILREFMADVRIIERWAIASGTKGRHCATCALEESTDEWKGFIPTAYGFLLAVYEPKKFMCHANQPGHSENIVDLSKLRICTGFRTILTFDPLGVYLAAVVAMDKLDRLSKMS